MTILSVTNKPARVPLALCLRVQYPGRLQSQPCVMLYSTRLRTRVIVVVTMTSKVSLDFSDISNDGLLHADVEETGN